MTCFVSVGGGLIYFEVTEGKGEMSPSVHASTHTFVHIHISVYRATTHRHYQPRDELAHGQRAPLVGGLQRHAAGVVLLHWCGWNVMAVMMSTIAIKRMYTQK